MVGSSSKQGAGWERIWRGLGSVRLALFLFLILGLGSIVGTVVPQGAGPAVYQQRYGEGTLRLLSWLGLGDLFHSWWFTAILSLLSLNLLICSFQRLPSLWKVLVAQKIKMEPGMEKDLSLKKSFSIRGENAVSRIEEVLGRRGYRIRTEGEASPLYGLASKGRWSRMGPYLVHLSILIVLLGATLGALFGFRGYLNLVEGESADSFALQGGKGWKKLGFTLRCHDFEASYYAGTQRPQDYRSDLSVVEGGKEVLRKTVRVNDPLSYRGIHFYQSSFGNTGQVRSVTLSLEGGARKQTLQIRVPVGIPHRVEGTDYSVQAIRFLPDFALDERFLAFSRSEEFNNPAALVEVRKGTRPLLRRWVFAKHLSFHGMREKGDLRVGLIDYEPIQFTGLQVTHDPGVPLVWAGFALMTLGLVASLLVTERRIWIQMTRGEGGWNLELWGFSRRGKGAFEQEFMSICTQLQDNGPHPSAPGEGGKGSQEEEGE
ncbi:MAG: cytochrome c biogenesis protein ResB [candidate division NC10 bacterium]|nr:cytochrome c biogenesis protein ResB [candidate division NC10 bacterium]